MLSLDADATTISSATTNIMELVLEKTKPVKRTTV